MQQRHREDSSFRHCLLHSSSHSSGCLTEYHLGTRIIVFVSTNRLCHTLNSSRVALSDCLLLLELELSSLSYVPVTPPTLDIHCRGSPSLIEYIQDLQQWHHHSQTPFPCKSGCQENVLMVVIDTEISKMILF